MQICLCQTAAFEFPPQQKVSFLRSHWVRQQLVNLDCGRSLELHSDKSLNSISIMGARISQSIKKRCSARLSLVMHSTHTHPSRFPLWVANLGLINFQLAKCVCLERSGILQGDRECVPVIEKPGDGCRQSRSGYARRRHILFFIDATLCTQNKDNKLQIYIWRAQTGGGDTIIKVQNMNVHKHISYDYS